ncbi:MAG: DUF416 family protein [Gemmataceae bacterium]
MTKSDFPQFGQYETYLGSALRTWNPSLRIILAAAIAERWFPAYQRFSETENAGNTPGLKQILHSIWDHARGSSMNRDDLQRMMTTVDDAAPHLDDFDAYQALAFCMILKDGLLACRSADNSEQVVRCLLSGFEAANGDLVVDSNDLQRVWKRKAVQKELGTQLDLIERVSRWPDLDPIRIQEFRNILKSALYAGPLTKSTTSRKTGPQSISNREAFELYRQRLEKLLSQPAWEPPENTNHFLALSIQQQWGTRYLHRMEAITGNTLTGQAYVLKDTIAAHWLQERNRHLDQADHSIPNWDPTMREMISLCLANPMNRYDARAIEAPHAFGPSIRRLFFQSKQTSPTDTAAWQSVIQWARHRPTAWDAEDRLRKKKPVTDRVHLHEILSQPFEWQPSGSPDFSWSTNGKGRTYTVRLNDFPDDLMYQCFVDDTDLGSFHDWPDLWLRPQE